MNLSKIARIIILGVAIFAVFFFIAMIGYSVFSFPIEEDDSMDDFETHKYKYFQYDPETEKLSKGMVSIPKVLGEDEFLSFENEYGKKVLISNFDSDPYKCSTTCYCDQGKDRRTASGGSLASRSVVYLVAAASSLFAYERARDYFDDECKSVLEDSCPVAHVKSIQDTCVLFESELKGDEGEKWAENGEVYCTGHCKVKGMGIMGKGIEVAQRTQSYKCDEMELKERVMVFHQGFVEKDDWFKEGRISFIKKLKYFCAENSYDPEWFKDAHFKFHCEYDYTTIVCY